MVVHRCSVIYMAVCGCVRRSTGAHDVPDVRGRPSPLGSPWGASSPLRFTPRLCRHLSWDPCPALCTPSCCSRPGSRCLTRRGYAHCREQGVLMPGNAPTALVAERLGATARLLRGPGSRPQCRRAAQETAALTSDLGGAGASAALPCPAQGQEGRGTGSIKDMVGPGVGPCLGPVGPAPSPPRLAQNHEPLTLRWYGLFQVSYLTAARLVSRAPPRWHVLQAGVRMALCDP